MLRSYWSIKISPNFPSFLSKHKKLIITNNMELELQPLNLPSDNERPFVIAGPCSAETEEQVMYQARRLRG